MSLEEFLVDVSDFKEENEIATGNFSSVYIAHPKNNEDIKVAIKKIPMNLEDHDEQKHFIREISIMANLNHPNLIKFVGFSLPSKFDKCYRIYSEYLPNKTLDDILKQDELRSVSEKILTPTKLSKIVYGIVSAMSYLHENKIVHRDLKPENIFLDKDFNPILADFGLSRYYEDDITMTNRLGTPYYMAPELFLDDKEITNKIDIYAFGITLLSLFSTKYKFVGRQPRSINQLVNSIISGKRYVIPSKTPNFYVNLIQKCWVENPNERPSFNEIAKQLERNSDFLFDGADEEEVNEYIKMNLSYKILSSDDDDFKYSETKEFDFSQF